MTTTRATSTRVRSTALAVLLGLGALGGAAACTDEDGDGGTTDEEIQEGKDTATSVGDEIEEEVDAQDEGSNEDGE